MIFVSTVHLRTEIVHNLAGGTTTAMKIEGAVGGGILGMRAVPVSDKLRTQQDNLKKISYNNSFQGRSTWKDA
eukprot:5444487-Amphidinium_carterae.1